jgi:hypothetical protein
MKDEAIVVSWRRLAFAGRKVAALKAGALFPHAKSPRRSSFLLRRWELRYCCVAVARCFLQ